MLEIKRITIKLIQISILVMLIVSAIVPTGAYGEERSNLKPGEEREPIRVGYFQLSGFNEISKNGVLSGYGYEYLMEIAKYTGWNYDFVCKTTDPQTKQEKLLTYEEALQLLEEGRIDLVCNVRKTPEMEDAYLFPNFPMGNTYGILSSRGDNTSYSKDNPESLRGINVGMIAGNARNAEIEKYLRDRSIPFAVTEFQSVEDAKNALLESKTIDAMYTSSLRHHNKEKVIIRMVPDGFFPVVNKNNRALCNELDSALEEILVREPQLTGDLFAKYYGNDNDDKFTLTPEEKQYIKENPVVTVGIDPYLIPIEYYEMTKEGKQKETAKGISGDVLAKIAAMTGITFKPVSYNDYASAIKEQHVEMFAAFAADYPWANKNNIRLTKTYLRIPISAVTRSDIKNYTEEDLKVAVLNNYFLTEQLKKKISEESMIYFRTMEQCVQAVNDGKADVTYIPTYSADYFSAHTEYTNIRNYLTSEFNYELAMGVVSSKDSMLYRIMNKALRNIPHEDIDNMVFNNTLFHTTELGLMDYIHKYLIYIILILLGICGIIYWVIFRYRRLRKRVKHEMHLSNERIHIALAQTNVIVWDYNLEAKKIIKTKGGKSWPGLTDEIEDVPESFIRSEYLHPESVESFRKLFADILEGVKVASGLFRIVKIKENGEWTKDYLWIELKLTNIFDKAGKPIHAVGLAEDVTEKVCEELRLKEKASRDPLTNLLNRTSFQACVQEFLNKEYKEGLISALIIIDTDDFKMANDTYGHFYGDEVLKGIATRLTKCFRAGDFVGRLGGDEFVIFMKNAKSHKIIEEKAKQICNSLIFEKDDLITTCSVGIALVSNRTADYNTLYKYADEAMYEAKKIGKCRYVIYDATS